MTAPRHLYAASILFISSRLFAAASFPSQAVPPPLAAFARPGMTERSAVAMLRMIDGQYTRSSIYLGHLLDGISRAHRYGRPQHIEGYKERIHAMLRKEVSIEQAALPRMIADLVWPALSQVPSELNRLEFHKVVSKAIGADLEKLAVDFIALHEQVLDLDVVYRIIQGELSFDPFQDADRLWRKRNPARDDRHLREAVLSVARGVIRGVYDELPTFSPDDPLAGRKRVLERGIDRGVVALGAYDVGAFQAGGTVAMARRGPSAPEMENVLNALAFELDHAMVARQRNARVDLGKAYELVRGIQPAAVSAFDLGQLSDPDRTIFDQFVRSCSRVMINGGRAVVFVPTKVNLLQQHGQIISKMKRVPYLGRFIYLAEVSWSLFRGATSVSEQEFVFTDSRRSPDETARYRAIRASQDHLFTQISRNLPATDVGPEEIAATIVQEGAPVQRAIYRGGPRAQAAALIAFAAELGGAIARWNDRLKKARTRNERDSVYADVLDYLARQQVFAQRSGNDPVSRLNYMKAQMLLTGISVHHSMKELAGVFERDHRHPAYAALALLSKVYEDSYYPDAERRKMLRPRSLGAAAARRRSLSQSA